MRGFILLGLAAIVAGTACAPSQTKPTDTPQAGAQSTPPGASSMKPPMASAGPASPEKLTAQDKKELAALDAEEKQYLAAKEAFKKAPKDAAARSRYIALTTKFATDTMISPALLSKVKYPKALRLYREVLETDPNNEEAKKNKDMIVEIYGSLGMPVPK